MDQILSITLLIKRSKTDKNGLTPIYLRVSLNGKKADLSTHRKINSDDWDINTRHAKGTSEEARILNNYLDNLKTNTLKKRRQNYLELKLQKMVS